MSVLPWIVYSNSNGFYQVICRLGTRAEAEMHAQSLNRLVSFANYKVCWDKAVDFAA